MIRELGLGSLDFYPMACFGLSDEGAILVTPGLGKQSDVYALKGGVENLHPPGKRIGLEWPLRLHLF